MPERKKYAPAFLSYQDTTPAFFRQKYPYNLLSQYFLGSTAVLP